MTKKHEQLLQQIANRLPIDIAPNEITSPAILSAVSRLKTERNNALDKEQRLIEAVKIAFGEKPICCDGVLLVPVASYERIAGILNS